MRTFINATKDSTIYERYSTINTGLDEILEIGKVKRSTDERVIYASGSARALIAFDVPTAQQYPVSASYYLNLRIANAANVNRYQELKIYPISRSWVEGSGYFYQDVANVSDGVTWVSASNATTWTTPGGDYTTQLSGSYILQKFPLEDIKFNITNIISPVISGSNVTSWNGLLIKFPTSDELDSSNTGNIKVFSSNTHTIFSPTIEVVWNDQIFLTGSLKPLPSSKVSIIPKNLKSGYTQGEIDKIYLVVRDLYPDRRFDAVQRYRSTYYLPSESYFRITDQASNTVIHDFDQYSAINCDASGSYILLDTSGLYVDRYYTLDLKVKTANLVMFPEFNYTFKVDTDA